MEWCGYRCKPAPTKADQASDKAALIIVIMAGKELSMARCHATKQRQGKSRGEGCLTEPSHRSRGSQGGTAPSSLAGSRSRVEVGLMGRAHELQQRTVMPCRGVDGVVAGPEYNKRGDELVRRGEGEHRSFLESEAAATVLWWSSRGRCE